ncbi:MAG: sigma 54-interacting transcriptional regulator [Proteobacteria bacterium]|nr:sigma 54-interacting transcriptional regulator [Pseudomonadota bacterium]MBU1714806.1 sigma 54-interacting transcriptional regulator [Pseudomonadota bacterium]
MTCWPEILEILNGVPHGIALLDDQLRITEMNQVLNVITGYASEEVRGIREDYVLRGNFADQEKVLHEVLANGEMAVVEGDMITANRRKIPVRLTVSPVTIQSVSQPGLLMVVEDISLHRAKGLSADNQVALKDILGFSPRMQEIFELLPVLAHTDATVLVTGETGTGKDLLAEAIHKASKRAAYSFIKVNCGALPENLLESELFGHVRGAFTGAHSDKPGLFRLAQGGTIFLTEIGDLPLPLQVKLLTVLDDREFYPVGSSKKVKVDIRLITGTHRNLKELVDHGKFREDLYFRLNVLRAHLPPLREREGDIRLLRDHFVQLLAGNLGKKIKGFGQEAAEILNHYYYPGNVRELRNIVEYAVNICPGAKIEVAHLPTYIHSVTVKASQSLAETIRPEQQIEERQINGLSPLVLSEQAAAGQPVATSWSEIEKKKILAALSKTGGNRSKASKELGWGRSTLWRKINQYNLA